MIKVLFTFLLCPLMLPAQDPKPYYKNDTLYATCGYAFYKGQTLHFAKGSGKKGQFRYITIKNGFAAHSLINSSMLIKDLQNIQITPLDVGYVDIIGTVIFKDSSKGNVVIQVAFDKAIENDPNLHTELVVPPQFRNSSRVILHQQLNKLFTLYASGSISKEAYEAQKSKLLEQ
ncbi:MAG: SHOCT domain-containing protein [Ferruginibacter sp.]